MLIAMAMGGKCMSPCLQLQYAYVMCKSLPIDDIYICIQTWNILYMMYVFTDMATTGTLTEGGGERYFFN